jgi:hypothetical protein
MRVWLYIHMSVLACVVVHVCVCVCGLCVFLLIYFLFFLFPYHTNVDASHVDKTPFVLFDEASKEVFVVGTYSSAVLRNAIFDAAQRFASSEDAPKRVQASLFSVEGEKPVALFHEDVLPSYLVCVLVLVLLDCSSSGYCFGFRVVM